MRNQKPEVNIPDIELKSKAMNPMMTLIEKIKNNPIIQAIILALPK